MVTSRAPSLGTMWVIPESFQTSVLTGPYDLWLLLFYGFMGIVCVVSRVISFSNNRPCLETYSLLTRWTITSHAKMPRVALWKWSSSLVYRLHTRFKVCKNDEKRSCYTQTHNFESKVNCQPCDIITNLTQGNKFMDKILSLCIFTSQHF